MGSMIDQPVEYKARKVDFVPLVGGPGTLDSKYHVNTIVYNVANTFGGSSHFVNAAAVVEKKKPKTILLLLISLKKYWICGTT